jgi:hypothetical protein
MKLGFIDKNQLTMGRQFCTARDVKPCLLGEGTRTSSFASRQGVCLNKDRPITDASGYQLPNGPRQFDGCFAIRFHQMVEEQGGLQAAKTLLASKRISDGFAQLYMLGRLDISMENLVLQEPWSSLFADTELAVARRRLGGQSR